jgi:hypothetical protein
MWVSRKEFCKITVECSCANISQGMAEALDCYSAYESAHLRSGVGQHLPECCRRLRATKHKCKGTELLDKSS